MRSRSRMTSLIVGVFGVVAVGVGAAYAQDVSTNFLPSTDFAKYKTYKWVEIQGAEKPDQIVDGQIKQAIDKNLATKGLTKATGDAADLFVAYQVAVQQERQWNAYNTGGMGPYRYGGMGGTATATSSTIKVGTLVLDMYDSAAKELVWKGTATKTLNPSKDPAKNQQKLQKAMDKLLKDFPPKPKT